MRYDPPKIMAYGPPVAEDAIWPGPVAWRHAAKPPARAELLADEWDYCYLGYDCDILDRRLFLLAADYAAYGTPDVLLCSSPAWQAPAGKYEDSAERYQILCEMAVGGGLYAMGNKFFSRRLVAEIDVPWGAGFLNRVFCRIASLTVLARPWVAVCATESPGDADFFMFVDHYVDANGGGEAAWI